jgi:hypothetical protein
MPAILTTQKIEMRKIVVEGQFRQRVSKTHLSQLSMEHGVTPVVLAIQEAKGRRVTV